ncbi:MAG: hypothetical protein Q9202_000537 [Teloschistes flavicans]
MLLASPLPPHNPLARLQPLHIPPPLTFHPMIPTPSSSLPSKDPWPGATALQTTCRELQTLIANSNRTRQTAPTTTTVRPCAAAPQGGPVLLQSPIELRTHPFPARKNRADRVQKPRRPTCDHPARLLRAAAAAAAAARHHTCDTAVAEKQEVDYEGIRDMFKTPAQYQQQQQQRTMQLSCDEGGEGCVVVRPGGSRKVEGGYWRGGGGDEVVVGLGRGEEARVGMLLRRLRLGGVRTRKVV